MKKILFSWVAKIKDFKKNDAGDKIVDPNGPTLNFHKYHWNHDQHIILYSNEVMGFAAERIKIALNTDFPNREIKLVLVEITDILNLQEIKSKVERQVYQYKNECLDFFFSPGAPMMQLSWYLIHQFSFLKSRLLQLKEARFSPTNQPELLEIELEMNDAPSHALIRQISLDKPIDEHFDTHFLLTQTLKPIYEKAEKVAGTDHVRVLLEGETGTGKEHLARHIHNTSGRRDKPFLAVNCGALHDELLLSTLFGHKKGAYTGARKTGKACSKHVTEELYFWMRLETLAQGYRWPYFVFYKREKSWPLVRIRPKK